MGDSHSERKQGEGDLIDWNFPIGMLLGFAMGVFLMIDDSRFFRRLLHSRRNVSLEVDSASPNKPNDEEDYDASDNDGRNHGVKEKEETTNHKENYHRVSYRPNLPVWTRIHSGHLPNFDSGNISRLFDRTCRLPLNIWL